MARASTVTKLPMDRWCELVGVNPIHFNGMYSELTNETCRSSWTQYQWQNAYRVGREEIARAIQRAEMKIESYVGYSLLPTWQKEVVRVTRPVSPELYGMNINPRYGRKSISLGKGYIICGGQKAKTLIEAGAAVVRSDVDGDGYDETMTVTVATTITSQDEIRAYYPGESGADKWEIRPITVSVSGGVATIVFKSWQLVDPDLQESINPQSIDADVDGNYLTTVDVYRVYNDPQEQALFMWENLPDTCDCGSTTCYVCAWGTQYGCLQVRDSRLAFATYAPGSWDADNEAFTPTVWSYDREPDKVTAWYYAGWRDMLLDTPLTTMDDYWADVVAKYSVSLLDRKVCECSNLSNFFDYWQEDLARQGDDRSFQATMNQIANVFGTTRGALYAYNACQMEGKKIGR